jgi:pyruvate formate lyase activating enzyme
LGVYPKKCLSLEKCGYCIKKCPQKGAPIEFDDNLVLRALNMTKFCLDCLKCADVCPPSAIKLWGEKMTVSALMKVIEADRNFYDRSGGGVTLNGGEVMLQWEFAQLLLKACKEAWINTCVETALHCPVEHMEAVYVYTDLVIADIKHMDSDKHRLFTGGGNELVLKNLIRTAQLEKNLIIRTPVVPGYNGDEQSIRAIGSFIKNELNGKIVAWQLLPFHKLGVEKYEALMMEYPMKGYIPAEREKWEPELSRLAKMMRDEYDLPAQVGTDGGV